MAHTDQDEASIIERQKQDIAHLNQQLNQVYGEESNRERAMTHVRLAMDEAIAMATRFAALPVVDGDMVGSKRRSEATRLAAYFRECKQNFEETLKGNTVKPAEKVERVENIGVDASEGQEPGSTKQE